MRAYQRIILYLPASVSSQLSAAIGSSLSCLAVGLPNASLNREGKFVKFLYTPMIFKGFFDNKTIRSHCVHDIHLYEIVIRKWQILFQIRPVSNTFDVIRCNQFDKKITVSSNWMSWTKAKVFKRLFNATWLRLYDFWL